VGEVSEERGERGGRKGGEVAFGGWESLDLEEQREDNWNKEDIKNLSL
jgi:hypothetical protein